MTTAQRNRKNRKQRIKSRAQRAAYVAAGLRCDGQPRAPRKPCGCWHGCLKCGGRGLPAEKVAALWAEFSAGKKMAAIERDHAIGRGSLRQIFRRRGYVVPSAPGQPQRDPVTGQVIPLRPATSAQIAAAIRKLKRIGVPPELRQEWKKRSMAWRMKLIRRIRAHVRERYPRPRTPFSKNVIPFEYGTPAAMRLAEQFNAGRTSQNKVTHIRPCSQGVIYQGRLWFWAHRNDGRDAGARYSEMGPAPRRALHHVIYEEHHGRIPARHTVIFRDGNKNNFAPENLALRSKADCARMNCAHRRLTGEERKKYFERIHASRAATMARRARAATARLLQNPSNLFNALQNRSQS